MADYGNVSPFVEAQLIIAAQECDLAAMDHMIDGMLPDERSELADACDRLAETLRSQSGKD